MIIEEVSKIVSLSWSKDTTAPFIKELYDGSNPSLGQCDITSLIVNDFVGGKIMRCMTNSGSHYYNLINNKVIDLTKEQFNGEQIDYSKGEERSREYLLSNIDTKNRYLLLLKNVRENFEKYGTKEYKLMSKDGFYLSKIPGTLGGNKKLKIYGKLDCPTALYWLDKGYYKNNRVFFENIELAEEAGYRPCSKCMKKEYKDWKKLSL